MTLHVLDDVPLENVEILDEYEANAFARTVDYLLRLEPERFLHGFYVVAGLTPTTTEGYGGWEGATGPRFQGHFFGHYISGLSQAYASSTGELAASLLARLESAVHGLSACQAAYAAAHPLDAGYVSAFSVDVLPAGADDLIVPFYNLHKVLAGLLHAHRYAPPDLSAAALDIAAGFGSWIAAWAGRQDDPAAILATEYGGMNDALYDLYAITGDPVHRRAGEFFDETTLFEHLAANEDVLDGLHANTTIPKLIGALKRYTVLTDSRSADESAGLATYRTAAENFWRMVVEQHTYANGGNSQAEHFHQPGTLHAFATNGETQGYGENSTSEGCNEYNMLKLTRELFKLTGDVRYADYYESTLINTILASQNPRTGMVTYFQPMAAGYAKVFGAELDEFWCDQGTALESFTKLGDSIYFAGADGLWVSQFRSSVVVDPEHNLRITQHARVPESETVTFTVDAIDGHEAAEGLLRLRVPGWATGAPGLTVNGSASDLPPSVAGGWLVVPVRAGDVIDYRLTARIEVVDGTEDPNWVAFRYGPVLLAAELSREQVDATYEAGVLVRLSTAVGLDADVVVADPAAWKAQPDAHVVRVSDGPNGNGLTTMRFALRETDERWGQRTLEPYYSLFGARYAVYVSLVPPAG